MTESSAQVFIMSLPPTEAASDTIAIWHFCAMALAEPDGESLDLLREQPYQPLWLATALQELSSLPLDVWQGEHTRLFTFPALCPPFASAYLEEGTLNGHRAAALETFYADLGLLSTGLPADYLGTICECAAFLHEENGPEVLRGFCQDTLSDWLDRFLGDLTSQSELLFYRGLAQELARLAYACLAPERQT
ncbi:MAG: molecular chaperone TorD family protein [Acidithiobacillus sp.]|nr:molecular chaperone TorD family protein [Acidithiobacillus sp.]